MASCPEFVLSFLNVVFAVSREVFTLLFCKYVLSESQAQMESGYRNIVVTNALTIIK